MRSMLRWVMRAVVAVAVVVALLAAFNWERVTRLMAVNSLFAPDRIVGNFIAMNTLFEHTPLPITAAPNRLESGPAMEMPEGFDAWIEDRAVTGIIVLQDGVIRHESYPLTAEGEEDPAASPRISWSIAKSYLSVLMGTLHDDGTIPDLDVPVTDYAPALAGTAYDGATIRDVLQMSSGVVFDEDYFDFWSDINRMGRVLALGQSMDGFAAALQDTFIAPGEEWQYVSIDTHVVGMVIRGATGRSVAELLTERVLDPLGQSGGSFYLTDGFGVAFVLGGLNMTTHDYALFGHMVASGGEAFGTRIVSEDWLLESTAASANTEPGAIGYGYQWWIPVGASEGQFQGRGIYGQYLYIDRPRGVVIAVNGADRRFRDDGVSRSNDAMFRAIAAALD